MLSKFIELFKKNLVERLQEKTSWGRNDLLLAVEQTLTKTLTQLME